MEKMNDTLLTPLQKQLLVGGLMLALGVAAGVAIAPDDPKRDEKLAALGSQIDSATPNETSPVDVAEYHRTMSEARKGRSVVDLLTKPIGPGELVTAEVNMPLGTKPGNVELVGLAEKRFVIDCLGCGVSFEDRPAADATTIRLRAQNTSRDVARLVALVHYTTPP